MTLTDLRLFLTVVAAVIVVVHFIGLSILLMISAFTWGVIYVYAALDYYLIYHGIGLLIAVVILLFNTGKDKGI